MFDEASLNRKSGTPNFLMSLICLTDIWSHLASKNRSPTRFLIHVFKTAFRFACPISKVIYQPHLDCEPSGRTCSKQISRMRRRPLPRVFDSKAPRLRRDIGSPLILPAKAGHSLAVHQLMAVVIDNTGVHLLCIQVDIAVVLMHTVIESHRSPPCVVTYWITRRR